MKTIEVTQEGSALNIDVRRPCRMTDLVVIYRVHKEVLSDGQEGMVYYEDFDEYYCNNCEDYDIDFEEGHPYAS